MSPRSLFMCDSALSQREALLGQYSSNSHYMLAGPGWARVDRADLHNVNTERYSEDIQTMPLLCSHNLTYSH